MCIQEGVSYTFSKLCNYSIHMHVHLYIIVTKHIMGAMASPITSLTIVYSVVYSDAGQRKHQSSASLAFVRGIHRWPMNSLHKGPVTRKMVPFGDVIMKWIEINWCGRKIWVGWTMLSCCFHISYKIHILSTLCFCEWQIWVSYKTKINYPDFGKY